MQDFVENVLIDEMKNIDKCFKGLFQKTIITGPFYDGLKVADCTEFELGVVFNLPFFGGHFEVLKTESKESDRLDIQPGSVIFWTDKTFQELLPANHPCYSDFKFLQSFFECLHHSGLIFRQYKYILLPTPFLFWFNNLLQKTIEKIIYKNTSSIGRWWYGEKFKYSKTSDVISVTLQNNVDNSIGILEINCDSGTKVKVKLIPFIDHRYEDVTFTPNLNTADGFGRLWNIVYPFKENSYFTQESCSRKVLKLLKLFRDMQGSHWCCLLDYHLKTIVMTVLKDDQKWLEERLEEIFRRSIEKLFECITTEYLPLIHDESLNLFDNIDNNDLEAVKTRLDEIVIDIRNNSSLTVKKYFLIEECRTTTIDGKDPPPPSSCSIM